MNLSEGGGQCACCVCALVSLGFAAENCFSLRFGATSNLLEESKGDRGATTQAAAIIDAHLRSLATEALGCVASGNRGSEAGVVRRSWDLLAA